jgi:hypothetical protein
VVPSDRRALRLATGVSDGPQIFSCVPDAEDGALLTKSCELLWTDGSHGRQ